MIDDKALTVNLDASDLSEGTTTASQLYAHSLMQDMLMSMVKRGKHNKARALRAKSRIAKRKAKRKS